MRQSAGVSPCPPAWERPLLRLRSRVQFQWVSVKMEIALTAAATINIIPMEESKINIEILKLYNACCGLQLAVPPQGARWVSGASHWPC